MGAIALGGLAGQACGAGAEGEGATESGTTAGSGASGTNSGAGGSIFTGEGGAGGGFMTTTGSGGFNADASCASVSEEAQSQVQPADIILLVDTSGSMDEESAMVQAHLNNFASIIMASGIDVHVILIAEPSVCIPPPLGNPCPADENLPTYRHVAQTVASTDALQLVISTYPQWKGSLRPNASKTIAVVTDDNSSLGAADFTTQLLALDPPTFVGFKFDAIIAPNDGDECSDFGCMFNCGGCVASNKCCYFAAFGCDSFSASEGTVYKQLIAQTGGVEGDLCQQDFGPVFLNMATAVVEASVLSCDYPIPTPPDGGTIAPNKVNVAYTPGGSSSPVTVGYVAGGAAACGSSGGWYYDDPSAPTLITMCPATCTVLQNDTSGKVEVQFGCDTIPAVPD